MKEPELDQFMSPEIKYYAHKNGLFPLGYRDAGPNETSYCLRFDGEKIVAVNEDGTEEECHTHKNFLKEAVREGVWVEIPFPFKKTKEDVFEFLKGFPSEVAAKGIIEWMKSDFCSSDDFHEIKSYYE